MEASKNVTIGKFKYRIDQMGTLAAMRCYQWMVAVSRKIHQETSREDGQQPAKETLTQENLVEMSEAMVVYGWSFAAEFLSEDAVEKIQKHALKPCFYLDAATDGVPMPVLMSDGVRFSNKEIEQDAPSVAELVQESLKFSLAPFFLKGLALAIPKTPTTK